MTDSSLFLEVDWAQRSKEGQHICGDVFLSKRFSSEGRIISVLSDGLGSGVKANILSSMTATMALKFTAANRDIVRASEVIMDALPVCRLRQISYATFSIVDAALYGHTRLVEQGNPDFLLVRKLDTVELQRQTLSMQRWRERSVQLVEFQSQPGDRLVVFSDGVTQAGLGSPAWKLGWRSRGCREFILQRLARQNDLSARQLAAEIVAEAVRKEPGNVPHDDISCAVLYFRRPRRLLVVSGPPFDKDRDREIAWRVKSFPGRTAVCGGTTSDIVARVLGRQIQTPLSRTPSDLPPVSTMQGVDLVTEGILTLTRVAQMLERGSRETTADAAGRLLDLMIDSDHIEFLIGTRINEAHQDPTLPVELEIRRNMIKRLARSLRETYLKDVTIQYI